MPLPPPETIVTRRLTLRPLREDDAGAMHAAFGDPDCVVYWWRGAHESLDETRKMVGENATSTTYRTWAITEPDGPDADQALGWVTLVDVRPDVANIGYILRRDRWGRGYMTEAAGAVAAHGFDKLGLQRIGADVDPDNAASIGVLEALGFAREGHLRAAWKTHLGPRDSVIFGKVRAGLGD